jgi:ankyrin repeat protein
VELANIDGFTPLMVACQCNLKKTAGALALRVRDLEVEDNTGRTALSWAARCASLEVVKMLTRHGAGVRTKNRLGRSVFHYACMNGRLTTAEYFLAEFSCFSVHDCDSETNQALHLAAFKGEIKAVEWLVSHGAEVDATGNKNQTPLMVASFYGKIHVARVLFQAGADVNNPSARYTSLGLASFNGQLLMAKQLLLWGADSFGVGTNLETAHQVAERRGHPRLVKLLGSWGSIQAVWVVLSAGHVRRVAKGSDLKRFPKELCRMVWEMLVRAGR